LNLKGSIGFEWEGVGEGGEIGKLGDGSMSGRLEEGEKEVRKVWVEWLIKVEGN
jgi:hypothetical protein